MAEKLTKAVVNCSTGEQEIVELTQAEVDAYNEMIQQIEADKLLEEQAQAQKEADKASAISKLTALGLTEDEALALVGQ